MKGKISLTEKPTRKHSKTKKSRREAKLEPLTCGAQSRTLLPLSKNTRRHEKISPWGGGVMFYPRKKTPSIQLKPQTGYAKPKAGRKMPPKMLETPPSPGIRSFPGDRYYYICACFLGIDGTHARGRVHALESQCSGVSVWKPCLPFGNTGMIQLRPVLFGFRMGLALYRK